MQPARFSVLLLLLLFSLSITYAVPPTVQSEADALPPQVIGVVPFPGEEMAVDVPLTVTFDQAMDRASVESAFGLDPTLEGVFVWTEDDKTLRFSPETGWERGTDYTLTIGTGARSAEGGVLADPYTVDLRSAGYLAVGATIPADGAEAIASNVTITVAFTRPVVPLLATEELDSLPDPLQITPALAGQGEWVNSAIYQFTPDDDLLGGVTYSVTVKAGLEAINGAALADDYAFSFTTLMPEILSASPQPHGVVGLESGVQIVFSQPMDTASVEGAFALLAGETPVSGAFTWTNDDSVLSFQPDDLLTINSRYNVVIDGSAAMGRGGASLREGREFTFITYPLPYVDATMPSNGQQDYPPGLNTAAFYFGTPMNTETFADRYRVEPDPGEITPLVYGDKSLSLQFEFQPNTRYTVTLEAGAEDVYGNAITSDYSYSFNVGEITPYFYLQDSNSFVVTGAYRENTVLPASIAGQPEVDFTLYSVPTTQAARSIEYLYGDDVDNLAAASSSIRTWREKLTGPSTFANVPVFLNSAQGGALDPGLYLLRATYDSRGLIDRTFKRRPYPYEGHVSFAVVNTTLTVKRAQGEAMVWVTDMLTGEPIPDVTVSIHSEQNMAALDSGPTDADGIARFSVSEDLIAVVDTGEHFGLWYNSYAPSQRDQDLYLYTDRPLYRPGETLYFRGAYRLVDDFVYRVADLSRVNVRVTDQRGEERLNTILDLTEFGTFSGEVLLPEDTNIGTIYINVTDLIGNSLGSTSVQVAEFRVPEFMVNVEPAEDSLVSGDDLRALITGEYFAGGALSRADVSWTVRAAPTRFNYTGPGRYTFGETPDFGFYYDECCYFDDPSRIVASGEGQTSTEGSLLVEVPGLVTQSNAPEAVSVEATISDESGQFISGRGSTLVHPADVYVGLRTDQYFGQAEQPFSAGVITVTPDSVPVTEQNVTLILVEQRWERESVEGQFGRYTWNQTEVEIDAQTVTTDESGRASVSFTPPNAGRFVVRASTFDRLERTHTSTVRLWVTGPQRVWWGQPSNQIDLIADQDSYVPGDTAQVLVPISLEGRSWVLVSVERAGVRQYEVLAVDGSTLVYELPLTEDDAPGVFLSVMAVHGIDEDNTVPTYREATILLNVEPEAQKLDVTITPSQNNAQPGDTVTFDIAARDSTGEPVQAEFGLALVDQAILTLSAPNSSTPLDHYYRRVSNLTTTRIMLSALLDGRLDTLFDEIVPPDMSAMRSQSGDMDAAFGMEMAEDEAMAFAASPAPTQAALDDGVGAADRGFEDVTVRQDFQQTPLWEAHVITDATGRAQVSVTLPDNLTIWDLTARGLTLNTRVAEAKLDLRSTLPLLVRPATPRFFVVGDEVTLAAVVNNNSDDAQDLRATVLGEGFELLDGESLEQSANVEAGGRYRFTWRVRILDVQHVDLTFVAIGVEGYQDASKPPIAGQDGLLPVYRYTAPDTVGTGGVLRAGGARMEGISIPPYADTDQGTLTVQLDPSLAVTTVDSLDYLRNFEHQCIEQTVSRFLPNVITYQALERLGISDPALKADLDEAVAFGLTRLEAAQNPDGGWGWFASMESSSVVSAYAVLGLVEARAAGFDVDREMIDRGAAYVRSTLNNLNPDSPTWQLNQQAFAYFVLSRDADGRYDPSLAELDSLFRLRLQMNIDGHAYLLMAYNALAQRGQSADTAVEALRSDLVSAVRLSATGAHWEETYRDWWNWGSDVRSTALALSALIETDPSNELLPNVVRWLMVAREGRRWASTQETAWSVMALTDWMVETQELDANYDYTLVLNSAEQAAGTVTPETVRESQTLTFNVRDLLQDEVNRLSVLRTDGTGALYYTAHLALRLDASRVSAADRGLSVTREYLVDGEPVTEVNTGDVVTVRLTLTLPDTLYYFVLEDPLPAGLEVLDTSLLTTSREVERPTFNRYDSRYYWGWWVWRHTAIRDESVNLYADRITPGTYVYSYQAQAITPGRFQTMPAHGYTFYFPEVFGRSDGTLFTINDTIE